MFVLRNILPFFFLLSSAYAQGNNIEFGNENITVSVKVNANQPRYVFYHPDDPQQNKYKVSFSKIYESLNGKKVGGSNLALASIDWVITEDEEAPDTDVVFWINGTVKENPNKDEVPRFSVLAFRNQIINSTVKFDVYIQNYIWIDENAETLDLEWKMTNSTGSDDEDETEDPENPENPEDPAGRRLQDGGDEPASTSDNKICFAGAGGDEENKVCWEVVEEATVIRDTENSTTAVKLDLEGGFIKVKYVNWGEGDLLHDPTFGFVEGTNFDQGCAWFNLFCLLGSLLASFLSLFGF